MQPSAAIPLTHPSQTVMMMENSTQVWARKPGNGMCIQVHVCNSWLCCEVEIFFH